MNSNVKVKEIGDNIEKAMNQIQNNLLKEKRKIDIKKAEIKEKKRVNKTRP